MESGSVSNEYGSKALVAILWLSHWNSYCVCLLGKVGRTGMLRTTYLRCGSEPCINVLTNAGVYMPLFSIGGTNLLRLQLLRGTVKENGGGVTERSSSFVSFHFFLGWLVGYGIGNDIFGRCVHIPVRTIHSNYQCCGSMTFWCGSGSLPLTNGSGCGCGSFYFHQWPSRCQQKTNLKKISRILLFEGTFTSLFKGKN